MSARSGHRPHEHAAATAGPLLAAIYARKSTDQSGVSEDERSVTRQVEHARQYAARHGWLVIEEAVYIDDGVSGAEFVKRPGFLRLMNSLRPRPPPSRSSSCPKSPAWGGKPSKPATP